MSHSFIFSFIFLFCPFLCASNLYETPLERTLHTTKGAIFLNDTYTLVEEFFSGGVRRSHPLCKTPTRATIEMLGPDAILHQSYCWYDCEHTAVQSFSVTPANSFSIQTPLEPLPQWSYAKLPVRLNRDKTLELLVFDEQGAQNQKDYARTIAGALHLLLSSYIPASRMKGYLPRLQQVVVKDSNAEVGQSLIQISDCDKTLATHYAPPTFCEKTELQPYWEMIFMIENQKHKEL